ncbi:MAG: D-alanine--D-alanine ligase [Planctomycetota bacterium]|jgi:D-alanine-D-alanine ligase|nr:D-alanine--D-alanine ligase [Planctomycetota bacterium]
MDDFTDLQRLKTAVLCGGPGVERAVSLESGDAVWRTLTSSGFRVTKAVLPEVGYNEYLEKLDCQVAVMMLHGEFGEDGQPQAILERRGIPFSGPDSETCRLAIDKAAVKARLDQVGVATPRWLTPDSNETPISLVARLEASEINPPLVVKPNSRGSSVGISIINKMSQLPAAIALAREVDEHILIEEFISGRELTIGWLDGEVLPIIELTPDGPFYDYRAKYKSDKTRYICPAHLDPLTYDKVREMTEAVLTLTRIRDISRVDIILSEKGPYALEVNTSPGFTSHSLVPLAARQAGITMAALCSRLVEMAANRAGLAKGQENQFYLGQGICL